MTAGYLENVGGLHLAVRGIIVPGEGDCESRAGACLRMRAEFFSRALTRAEADGVTVIQSHTHPFSGAGLACSRQTMRASPSRRARSKDASAMCPREGFFSKFDNTAAA